MKHIPSPLGSEKIATGVLALIGNTPLLQLTRPIPNCSFTLFAKLEGFNPGGSIKDRAALQMIQDGIETGLIGDDTTIIESSSGNMGIGLAQICRFFRLKFICVVDPKTTAQNLRVLEAFGAEIDMVTTPDLATGEFLQARLDRIQSILKSRPNVYWPNQYGNVQNSVAHHRTMREIMDALGKPPDLLFCSTSTCGTLRGCFEYVSMHANGRTKIVAVDALGSVIFGSPKGKRLIPGHGASVRPALCEDGFADRVVHVSDIDCIIGCRRLLLEEALLVGGSSGGTFMAIDKMREAIPRGATCVALFPDRGERYLDTIFSDAWVEEHFGHILGLAEGKSCKAAAS